MAETKITKQEFPTDVLKVFSTAYSGDATVSVPNTWVPTQLPGAVLEITPAVNCTAIIDSFAEVQRSTNASQEQDLHTQYKAGAGAWTDIGVGTLSSICASSTLTWSVERGCGTLDMTAGTTYQFRMAIASGSASTMTFRGRYIRVITIPR